MPRLPDPRTKGAKISFKGRNDEEGNLVKEFRRVLWKDGTEYMDFFKPFMLAKVQADNSQLHFKPVGDQMVLSKNLPSAMVLPVNPRAIRRTCPKCGGEGCQHCGNDGWIAEEPAP